MQAQETLRKYFGHEAFRPGQEVMVNALTHHRDALGVMPTGAGKSMCYQVPALMMPGVAIVISPLISLMADQVAALKARAFQLRTSTVRSPRARWISPCSARGRARTKSSTSPRSASKRPRFRQWRNPCRFPCLPWMRRTASPSGAGFPPGVSAYRGFRRFAAHPPGHGRIHRDRNRARPARYHPPIAPANPETVTTGFDRPNLYFEVIRPKTAMLPSWIFSAGNAAKAASFTVQRARRSNRSAII